MPKSTLPEWEQVLSAAAHLQQLQTQLANPLPYDLDEIELSEYKNLDPKWQRWQTVSAMCADLASTLLGCNDEDPA